MWKGFEGVVKVELCLCDGLVETLGKLYTLFI